MRTKLIPALISLLACAVICINSFVYNYTFEMFARRFIIAAIVFYIIGIIVKIIIDKGYDVMSDSLSDMEEFDMDEELIDNEMNDAAEEGLEDFEDISK